MIGRDLRVACTLAIRSIDVCILVEMCFDTARLIMCNTDGSAAKNRPASAEI